MRFKHRVLSAEAIWVLARHAADRVVSTRWSLMFFLDDVVRNLLGPTGIAILYTFHKKLKIGILHDYDY
jgi:hypothetical protein